jgi:hypothetical protein
VTHHNARSMSNVEVQLGKYVYSLVQMIKKKANKTGTDTVLAQLKDS